MEYLIWFLILIWYGIKWLGIISDCYSQFYCNTEAIGVFDIRYIMIFSSFSATEIFIWSQIGSDHLIDLLCIRWTKCFNSKDTHTCMKTLWFIHSFMISNSKAFGIVVVNSFVWSHNYDHILYVIQVHTRMCVCECDCKQKHTTLFIETW